MPPTGPLLVATLLGVALVGPWLFPLGPETAAWLAPWRKASRFLLVGAVWGCTNPLIAEGSKPHAETASPGGQAGPKSPLRRWAEDLFFTVTHWRFYLPFAINQLGSLLNVWLLGEEDMTLAVMMTNSMTFIFTAVTSRLVGETTKTPLYSLMGMGLILVGTSVCVLAKTTLAAPPTTTSALTGSAAAEL